MRATLSLQAVAVFAVLGAPRVAHAQSLYTTEVTCPASVDWAKNAQGHSPCLLAAYIQGACIGKWDVPLLPNQANYYNPPLPPNPCGCSFANFNALSACSVCQGGFLPLFSVWSVNCTNSNMLDTSSYYPSTSFPIPDGVTIPLWAQQDPRLWHGLRFNVTDAQLIVTTGKLIGDTSSSTTPTSTSSSTTSQTTTSSTNSETTTSPPADGGSSTPVGPIVGGVVGGVLGLLLVGVLFWYLLRKKRTESVGDTPSMAAVPFTGGHPGSNPTPPALTNVVIPIPQRPPPSSYPSYHSSTPPASYGTDIGHGTPVIMVENAPGILDRPGNISHPYATAGIGLATSPPPMGSNTSIGSPSLTSTPQRSGSSSSRSMISRFVFPRRRGNRASEAPSTMSQESSTMSHIGILHSPPATVGHIHQPSASSVIITQPVQPGLEPTPYILPPANAGGGTQGQPMVATSVLPTKARINPPTYTPPDAGATAPLPQPSPAIQAGNDINRLLAISPAPHSPGTPNPPSYFASQAENREEQLRRAASTATAGTRASSSNVLPTPSTPERRGVDQLPPVPEQAPSSQEGEYPQEKI